ncbi:MAG TPA: DUF3352 domain-containing protein [Planctomycetota bacterium]|nr:DUF3352 domain-containing protein [Planctomycetota bacterium]HRR80138.1 DUF3352 domain-containing protein [Planctomycetota bacterium]HRT94967.1 DUF3352 domain-containing protein [Planctomycetota bacterium]
MSAKSAAVVALALSAAVSFTGEPAEPTTLEKLVPADAVALVQATDVGRLAAAFDQSALAEAVKASRLLSYLRTAGGAAADFAATLLSGLPAAEFRACLGSHAALALLDFTDAADLRQRVPLVLLAEMADAKRMEGQLLAQLQLLGLLRGDIAITRQEQAGATVHELGLPNGARLAFAFRDGVLIAGGHEGVSALLATLAAGKPRLVADPTYQAVRQGLATPAGLVAYANLRALLQRLAPGADPAQIRPLQVLGIGGAQAVGLAMDFSGRQLRERLFLRLEGPPAGLLRLLTAGEPAATAAGQFVPQGYTAVLSMAARDVGLWDRLRTALMDIQGPAAADFLETVGTHLEQQLGIHPKKGLFDTLGDELFLAIDLTQLPKFYGAGHQPKPQEVPLLLGARLRDEATLKETSDRIAGNQPLWEKGIQRTATHYDGTSVYTFRLPMNPELRLSHAVVKDRFLFSLRPDPIVAALTAHKAGKVFAPAESAPAHLTLQVNDAQLLAAILACIRSDLPEAAAPLLSEADKVFASLHGYRATLRRQPDGVAFEACSDIGTAGTLLAALLMFDQGNAIIARRVESDFDQIGAALEAYRAKRGAYPETLDQLVPDFLPALANDRFEPARPYGYSRGRPGADGQFPDAWLLTSVGPDKRPDIPVEQFDPPVWSARRHTQDPEEIERIKRVVYRFRPEQFPDERKNDDEGDLVRMGGKGLAAQPQAPAPPPARKDGATKREDF